MLLSAAGFTSRGFLLYFALGYPYTKSPMLSVWKSWLTVAANHLYITLLIIFWHYFQSYLIKIND